MKINNNPTPIFRIRASALGQLMTQPKSKADKEEGNLSQTAKTMLSLWYKEQLYGRRKPLDNKYLTKGNECEDEAIAFLGELDNTSYANNKEQFSNDYMTGEPDVITEDEIIDIKNSWDCFTFPLLFKVCPSKDYEWQVLGYMWLCDKKKGRVVYTLMDTPTELIRKEYNKLHWGQELEDDETWMHDFLDFAKDYVYSHLPRHLRVKEFVVEYDADKVEQIKKKVLKAREYIRMIAL